MAGSSRKQTASWLYGALCVVVVGCTTGSGEGSATGSVWAPECGFDGTEAYELEPDFFAMNPSKDVDILDIRIQEGSEFSDVSNGISIFVDEAEMVKADLVGTDIPLSIFSVVRMTFYLNETCDKLRDLPVVYESLSGTIRFDELHVPWVDNENSITSAVFTNVEFADTSDPTERRANLSGNFSFVFGSGQPAQPFSP